MGLLTIGILMWSGVVILGIVTFYVVFGGKK